MNYLHWRSSLTFLALATCTVAFTVRAASTTCPTRLLSTESSDNDTPSFCVMINGMPGPMATASAEACLRKGLTLCPFALSGSQTATITVADVVTNKSSNVKLTPDRQHASELVQKKRDSGNIQILAIDYTHPSAVNENAKWYVENNIPFVMGTTGGDRNQLLQDCANHPCVVAPNMGKQIVALQAALENFANDFTGAFKGYKLQVRESHQVNKADTSGTAKAVVASLNKLTADASFTNSDIIKIRNEEEAMDFGVPSDALNGHAYHTYTLTSPDGSVNFELKHNVAGRTVYAEGTADAVIYLHQQMQKPDHENKVYTMIDVLKAGALE